MRACSFLILCVAAVSATSDSIRIAGGTFTTIDNYPSMVSISNARNLVTWEQVCGGSILNNRAILTAAHCTGSFALESQRVRVGSSFAQSGGTVYGVGRVIIHELYGTSRMEHDIAILHLNGFITYSNVVQRGRFAGATYNVPANDPVWAAGWGIFRPDRATSEQLRHTQLYRLDHEECKNRHSLGLVTDDMICLLPREAGFGQCSADSGSPSFHNGVTVGVLSFGSFGGCGSAFHPTVSISVSRYIGWIQNNA
ncbi:trypsin, alkaline B-like [Anticarsia gemmatalis]|uniref:trypsin, alkaline B-like n=1 Tax=Anticarsia gemmatalis TaxID=129554 RepID=UPI003F75A240